MVSLISRIWDGVRRSLMGPSSPAVLAVPSGGQDGPRGRPSGRDAGRDPDAVVGSPAQREPRGQRAGGGKARTVAHGILRQSPAPTLHVGGGGSGHLGTEDGPQV